MTSAKILFPNKAPFTGSRGEDVNTSLLGATIQLTAGSALDTQGTLPLQKKKRILVSEKRKSPKTSDLCGAGER